MDSDSAKACVVPMEEDSECIHVSNEPNRTGTCGDSSVRDERGGGGEGIDAVDTAAASELVPPEPVSPVREGDGAVLSSVAEISDVVEGSSPVAVVSSELSPAVMEVGGGEEENAAASNAQERDSMDSVCGVDAVEVVPLESSSVVGEGGEEEGAGSIVKEGDSAAEHCDSPLDEQANLLGLASEKGSISGDKLEESKEVSMEEESPEVNEVDSLKAEENREENEHVVCGAMANDESSQAIESELGQNIESEKEKVDVMEEVTTKQAASLEDMVNDIEIPDDKEVASVAGFTEIPSQDKGLDDSVLNPGSEFVEEEPLKELQMGEGAKDLPDGDAKEDVEERADASPGIRTEPKVEEGGVTNENRSENESGANGNGETSADFTSNIVKNASGEKSLNDSVRVASAGASSPSEKSSSDEKGETESDSNCLKPEHHVESSLNSNLESAEDRSNSGFSGGTSRYQETVQNANGRLDEHSPQPDKELENEQSSRVNIDPEIKETSHESEANEDVEKDEDMTDAETHGDSSVADIEEGRENHEEEEMTDLTLAETQEESVMAETGDEEAEEVEEENKSAGIEEVKEENHEEEAMTDLTKTQEESVMAETGDEEAEEVEEENMSAGIEEVEEENHEEEAMTDLTKTQEESVMAETGHEEAEEVEEENKSAGIEEVEEENHEEEAMTDLTKTQEESVMAETGHEEAEEVEEENKSAGIEEVEEENHEEEEMTDLTKTQEESVMAETGDEEAEEVEEENKSAGIEEVEEENHEEEEMTDLTETQEDSVMAETGDEEAEENEEENKSAGTKRKRVRNTKTVKGMGKKKEEDVCFMCFDGGDLVLCDRRGCPKAYHPSCVDRDEAFFQSKGKWNCGWHLCSKCEKSATYLCYTCMFSLCKGCAKDAVFFCIRGNKGLCETCMETVKLIERKEQEKEPAQLDFDDKTSWEYLFKDYWIDLKTQLSLSPKELDQAKSPQKGNESHAGKQGAARETDDVTDGGSDSDSSPKKRKTRSRSKSGSAEKVLSPANKSSSGETMEWASKELLDVVGHMRRGDRSFLPHSEVHVLLLDYIKRYNLRDPRRKSQVVCDSRLQNLFGKSHVGHFEMLNLLEIHFLKKEQQQADDIQGSIVDTEPDHVDVDETLDHPVKSGKDKKRKTRKKGVRKGRQSNLDDFAAVDMHNINLIYLRRSLVEDLLEDSTAFEEKVASAFVRLRISGNQKQDLYRLVQVVGTSKAPEPYKVGKKTTDFVLEILNLDKTEVISIDIISNQDFTEDECKRLKQSIKCGLINRLTVGDIQEKAIALQEVRVKNLLEAEILRFSHLRDRASDMGRRKELRECVEKLQLLKSPEERQRRLEEIPEIHADPKMDPECESEDEDEKEEKEKERNLRPRSSSFNRRGRDPISPRRGGYSSNDSWTSTSNYSNTSANRELTRSYSGRGSTGRGDYHSGPEDKVSESMWTSGRERETHQSLVSEKPRSISLPEPPPRSSRAVVPPELSPRIAPEISTAPPVVVPQPAPTSNDSEKIWHYKDPSGKVQGPFSMAQLRKWNNTGYFPAKLEIWKANESALDSIILTDALAGLYQKQTQSVDNSYTKAQVAAYSGQSSQSEPNLGSSARTIAPSVLDIPRNSQDTWSSGGGLPSPTPNQITTPTAKRRNFESRWSPTKPSAQSAVQSMSFPPAQASRTDIPVVVNSAGAVHPGTHPIPTPDLTNVSVNHYGSAAPLPSPTPAGGNQSWGNNTQTDKFDSHGRGGGEAPSSSQNSSALSYGAATPSVLPSQAQQGFPSSDPWRVPVPSQSNTQANNLQWGMNNSQNSGQPQAPANQNNSWGQATVNPNPNMGWAAPVQAGMNVNWTAPSVPSTGQGMPNPGWGGPVQGQPQAYQNAGWGVTGQAQAQPQAQGSSTGSGWMQPGQGMQSGNSNQNWGTQTQTTIPSGGSGGNQAGYWGNQQQNQNAGGNQAGYWGNQQQNQNGDSGYGWNRQSSGSGGGGQNNFKGQRVCKFFRENGHCRKGASCNYLHN